MFINGKIDKAMEKSYNVIEKRLASFSDKNISAIKADACALWLEDMKSVFQRRNSSRVGYKVQKLHIRLG